MAQEEPLYDFPEPTQFPKRKLLGHHRSRSSLRSISVLDRLLLTVPVWFQLSINPATALHILQREPPGTFLVRRSGTSKRNVLCVRLADDNVPSFVQQFGIKEEPSTVSLETSTISFPDLPRLISFYCVSRDVLRFPLELPEAIAKATSHKELESISHMGIEFWNSHLNVRGPREAPKPQKDAESNHKKTDGGTSDPPAAAPQTSPAAQPDTAPRPDSGNALETGTQSVPEEKREASNPTLFHEFCPITTRGPRELDCGSGQGALYFINPLFLQSLNPLCKRRMFSRSLRVRISTESPSLLSPPHAPPPPPPLMPKTRGKCSGPRRGQGATHPGKGVCRGEVPGEAARIDLTVQDTLRLPPAQMRNVSGEAQVRPPAATADPQPEGQEQGRVHAQSDAGGAAVVLDLDPTQASPTAGSSTPPSLSLYISPTAPLLCPKVSLSRSPYDSLGASSQSLSPKAPVSLSPYDSPNASPSLSPYQSPSPSPNVPFALSPFTSPSFLALEEQAYHTPSSRADRVRSERGGEKEGTGAGETEGEDGTKEELHKQREEEERVGLVLQMNAASLKETDGLQGAVETSPHQQEKATSL